MKLFKNTLLLLFISISLMNCGSDDSNPAYNLSKENLLGVYELTAYESERVTETTFETSTIVVQTQTISSDSFDDVEITFLENNGYTFIGGYRNLIETTSDNGTSNDIEIVNVDEFAIYTIDTTDETIIFNGIELNGEYNVDVFTSSALVLSKLNSVETDEDGFTTTTNTTITFEK